MKLEEQVCTLEQAKRLRDLGINKPSLFKWKDWSFDADGSEYRPFFGEEHTGCLPAYTVAELGEMLPNYLEDKGSNWYWTQNKLDGWEIGYERVDVLYGGCNPLLSRLETEAQARAAMLIHLLETGIISPSNPTEA